MKRFCLIGQMFKSKMNFSFGYLTMIIACLGGSIRCQTPGDVKNLLKNLFADYNPSVRPINDQTKPIILDISFFLSSINELDEVNEKMVTTGYLSLSWVDDLLTWTPASNNDIDEITVLQNEIWKPDLVLKNGFRKFEQMGANFQMVRVTSNGEVKWFPFGVFETRCSMDIKQFPYDEQICDISFTTWSYFNAEVSIRKSSNGIDYYHEFQRNSVWTVVSTTSKVHRSTDETGITFTIKLKRKPQYFVMNMIVPIVCLGILSILVFVIPVDAGEKMSYSITVFLSFAVFLTIISDDLPVNSESTSTLSIYLVLQMVIGELVLVISALQLRLHHRKNDQGMPAFFVWIVKIQQCLRCVTPCRTCRKENVTVVEIIDGNEEKQSAEAVIEWSDVTSAIDFISFWVFFFINVGVTLFLFLYISS